MKLATLNNYYFLFYSFIYIIIIIIFCSVTLTLQKITASQKWMSIDPDSSCDTRFSCVFSFFSMKGRK